MLTRIMALIVTTGLAAKALCLWMARDQRRRAPRHDPQADAVARWEDEGGSPASP